VIEVTSLVEVIEVTSLDDLDTLDTLDDLCRSGLVIPLAEHPAPPHCPIRAAHPI